MQDRVWIRHAHFLMTEKTLDSNYFLICSQCSYGVARSSYQTFTHLVAVTPKAPHCSGCQRLASSFKLSSSLNGYSLNHQQLLFLPTFQNTRCGDALPDRR